MTVSHVPPAEISDLTRVQDRLSFIYVERCVVHRDSGALTATDERGVVHIPSAMLGAIMLGPGTRITHQAMMLLAESGSTAVWVGEQGVRYYAHGRSLAESTRLLDAQAVAVTNQSRRLAVARRMYQMRFPGEDVAGLTMQQLRGKEGARVREAYREHSRRTKVEWGSRQYNPEQFDDSTEINQALSVAHSCLYGVVHAVIVSLGMSAGLGFIHTGHSRSFVYDIADLYKADVTIPAAFDVVQSSSSDIPGDTRRAVRDLMHDGSLLQRCVRDIKTLVLDQDEAESVDDNWLYSGHLRLWDGKDRHVEAGTSYGREEGA